MKWYAISGSWRIVNDKLKKDLENIVGKIISSGDGIVTGGALGVDYIATQMILDKGDVKKQISDKQLDCSDTNITTNIAMQNVRNMKSRVIRESKVIRNLLSRGDIKIVGALHDLETGIVTFE